MSRLINPFYSDVRTLKGFIPSKNGYACDRESEPHPVTGWWWRGIPAQLGHAIAIDERYQQLWPEFATAATKENGLALASVESWSNGETLETSIGKVPPGIAAKVTDGSPSNTPEGYPDQWPFEPPFTAVPSPPR